MQLLLLAFIYLLFFTSGAAALIYEVVWVRSLSLIFGGTHLAVTTILSVFMGGLALGSYIIGKRVDKVEKPLRLYGYLELGIALSAVLFIFLMKIFPSIYISLAQGRENSRLYLSVIRVVFAFFALIIPTTLMGGTLPVLSRFVSGSYEKMGSHLSLLYGINTLGAVLGAAAAGFFLLPVYSVSTAIYTAIIMNFLIGCIGIILQGVASDFEPHVVPSGVAPDEQPEGIPDDEAALRNLASLKLVLLGIGISGFCALGYEVLWTRILTLTVGASVYGFTTMLIAFLTGIGLGSASYGLLLRLFPSSGKRIRDHIVGFGAVEFIIGVTALFVTVHIRDLPAHSLFLFDFFSSRGLRVFTARQWANISIAFSYMVVPSFFMGLAFPLAGKVNVFFVKRVGRAVGGVLAYNTVGAILGSAVSGFFLIYLFGIERSLQMLTVINMGFGLLVIFSLRNKRVVNWTAACLTAAAVLFLAFNQNTLRVWDMKYFAIFRNNQPDAFDTPEKIRDAVKNTDVLSYYEGVDSTISSIRVKGGRQAVLVNGKVVASSSLRDRQCQLTLGHLPMLLHKDPKKVLVVGLGTGMTLGATSIHPEVEELTLAEIEPHVTTAARTFAKYNHNVLDNPKLKIVFNDGRNFLMTTKNKYDVITADPIHPWTQGSGYLYTAEYFKIASDHLRPGGIMCQWLPIYELSVNDLKSVVRTFSLNFRYTMAWMTQYDAEIIGSNSPLIIDEKELERRISYPPVQKDLSRVMMGSAADFLSYFVMGSTGMREFGSGGVINTDDNLYLEFSTPASVGRNVLGKNIDAIARHREDILPYLVPAPAGKEREEQVRRWLVNGEAAKIDDRAHALFLGGGVGTREFRFLLSELETKYPVFAPGRFLSMEYLSNLAKTPLLLEKAPFVLLDAQGKKIVVEISAVLVPVSQERAAVMFVDNAAKKIYGQRYFSGDDINERTKEFAGDVMASLRRIYLAEAQTARGQRFSYPAAETTMSRLQQSILERVGDSDEH